MPKIIFVNADGATREVVASTGQSVLEAALAAGVNGIVAECNGAAACATCHCYFDSNAGCTGEIGEHETELLEFTAAERTAASCTPASPSATPTTTFRPRSTMRVSVATLIAAFRSSGRSSRP